MQQGGFNFKDSAEYEQNFLRRGIFRWLKPMQGGVAASEQVVRRLPGTKRPYTLLYSYTFLQFATLSYTLPQFATLCYTVLQFSPLCYSFIHFATICYTFIHFATLLPIIAPTVVQCFTLPFYNLRVN